MILSIVFHLPTFLQILLKQSFTVWLRMVPIHNPPVSASLVHVFQMLSSTQDVDAHLSTFALESTFVNVLPYTLTILNEAYLCWTM